MKGNLQGVKIRLTGTGEECFLGENNIFLGVVTIFSAPEDFLHFRSVVMGTIGRFLLFNVKFDLLRNVACKSLH